MNAVKIKEILTWKVTSQPSIETLVISPFPFYIHVSHFPLALWSIFILPVTLVVVNVKKVF